MKLLATICLIIFFFCNVFFSLNAHELNIVASFYPTYIITKNVTKNVPNVKVRRLVAVNSGCLHNFTLNPNYLKALTNANILVINGVNMESFIAKISNQYPKIKILDLSIGINLIKEDNKFNPHIWLSVKNVVKEVNTLTKYLCEIDPENAKIYKKNSIEFIKKLNILDQEMKFKLARYKGRYFISLSDLFSYMVKDLRLKTAGIIYDHEQQLNAKDLAKIITFIKDKDIKVLFVSADELSSSSSKIIAKEANVKIFELASILSGPDDLDSYVEFMRNNIITLKKAYQ
ncbi:MAG: metal ABC transporter substrate-binding protein [Candidatus Margulisiibacteriota bacterium]|jgi:zinc transport system substrate-binding protein